MSYDTMSQAEALEIIQAEANAMGLGILETLQLMDRNLFEFGSVERCAFRVAMRGFRQLFAVKEEA
jgi:hypothetical protein